METSGRLIEKMYLTALLPNIIAVLGGTVNVFFDAVFVGQKLGDMGLSAVNQCMPVYLLLCTLGSLFASGASVLSSIAFGENKKTEGIRYFQCSLFCSFFFGLFFCVSGLIFSEPLSRLLSAGTSQDYVSLYIRITLLGGIFKVLLYTAFFYLRLEGKNRRSALSMLTMTILNIFLDYLFLFRMDLGIAGAAWASVLATVVACVLSFLFLFTDHGSFPFGFAIPHRSEYYKIIKYGSPMALNNVLSSARVFAINMILGSMGIAGLVSVFAVVNNLNEFSVCIQNGVPQTASAMNGVFFGEKDSRSVKKTLNIQIFSGIALSLLCAAVLALFSGKMGNLFGCSRDCSFAVLCFAASLPFATWNNIMVYYYSTTEKIRLANLITVSRGFAAVFVSCVAFSGLGERVWIFYPAAEIVTLALMLAVGFLTASKKQLSRFYLLDEQLERTGKSLSFSVECVDKMICEASEKINSFCEDNGISPKVTMAVSLSIEEILTIISRKSLMGKGTMDVRVLSYGDRVILRIRSGGKRYNPVKEKDESLDYMGVEMICRLSQRIEYHSTLGINSLIIFI